MLNNRSGQCEAADSIAEAVEEEAVDTAPCTAAVEIAVSADSGEVVGVKEIQEVAGTREAADEEEDKTSSFLISLFYS